MIGKKINQLATELAPVSTDLTIIGDPVSGVSKKITLAQLGAIFSGAVSFYTNLAAFPVVGDINVIYCAKDTQKLYLWSGSAYTEVFPSQALLNTYQLRSEKGNANGYASLDSSGKVPISQLPSSIMEYKGTWSASTNTPTLANGTGDTGDVYICNSPGSVNFGAGVITFAIGDYVIYSGTIWQRSSGAVGTVTSVAVSRSGDALAITGSPITTSGTINIGFAGTGTQYIKGDGTLATFPSIISQAQNLVTEVYNSTGATLTKGTIVYINGGQGNLPTVTKALATGDSTSAQTYGVVQNDITNMNNGYVVAAGRLIDLDTQAYTNGTQLYLSATTAGTWTSTKQYAPNHLVYIGIVVRAHPTQGVVEIKIQNGYEMDELHNVAAQTPSNNDGLFWEASTSLWKNKSIATILGGTPITGSGNVNAIPKFTANSVLGNSVMEDDGNFVSMRGLKLNASAGVGNTINFQQASGITAAGLGYSTIGAAGSTGIQFYLDQNVTERIFIFDTATITSNTARTYSMPDSSGTLALVSQLTGGTVTSVGLSSATSGVTIGSSPITTSGTITLAIATASGSQQGLLSSTDWTTFNNKQNALTNPVTGTGTTNYLPKFTGTSTIGNSAITDNGTITTSLQDFYITKGNAILSITSTNSGAFSVARWQSLGIADLWFGRESSTSSIFGLTPSASVIYSEGAYPFLLFVNGATRLTMSTSGNLGLGVTPSAWGVLSPAFEIGTGGSFISAQGSTSSIYIGTNAFFNGTSWIYKNNGTATYSVQNSGFHIWYTAPSGTAGNAISFTQAMTLTSAGELCVGRTSAYGAGFLVNVQGNIYASAALVVGSSVTAASATFSANGDNTVTIDSANNSAAILLFNKSNANKWQIAVDRNTPVYGGASNDINFYNGTSTILRLAYSTGAATFSSSVTAGSWINTANTFGLAIRNAANTAYRTAVQMNSSNVLIFGQDTDITALTFGVGSEHMRITSGGNVGIGTTTPATFRLSVAGDGNVVAISSSNNSLSLALGYQGTMHGYLGGISSRLEAYSNNGGYVYLSSSSTWIAASDKYRKKNFEAYNKGLNEICNLKPTLFNLKTQNDNEPKIAGLIAQEVGQHIKEAFSGGEFIGIDYNVLTVTIINAIKELKAELDTLKNK